nr:sigma-70 family RNA polymerase sigma factor [Spirosoma aerolatum]
MTKSSEQAEDFTHDIFLKAFTKLNAFQERSSFSTWLYSIAFNYCADQMRAGKRFIASSVEESLRHDMADEQESSFHEEAILFVKQAMATLSTTEQALLQLKYEQDMSIDEIAQIYQLTPSAVKMRLKRSRDKIYQLYNGQSA